MSEKTLNNIRIVHKHDIEENWLKAINFIPKQGELIIYDVDTEHNYERFKIGDGINLVNDLSFGSIQSDWNENDEAGLAYVKNRPFYETIGYSDTLTWDGNIEGLPYIVCGYDQFYYVCDTKLILEDLQNRICIMNSVAGEIELELKDVSSYYQAKSNTVFVDTDEARIVIVLEDVNEDMKAGIYFCYNERGNGWTQSLTIKDVNLSQTTIIKPLDKKYLPEHLQFGEEIIETDILTWNGNIANRYSVDVSGGAGEAFACLVSESVPTVEDLNNGCTIIFSDNSSVSVPVDDIYIEDDGFIGINDIGIVPYDNYNMDGVIYEKAGIYIIRVKSEEIYAKSLTIPNYKFNAINIETIDPKYLPELPESGVGKDVYGNTFTVDGSDVQAEVGAEIFNDYETNIAIGQYSHAEGGGTIALGQYSHAEGRFTTASNDGAHAEGRYATASNTGAHAEGYGTTASGSYSHAEGERSTASGVSSHTEGNVTTASGKYSHAEGDQTKASGNTSHAEGERSEASGYISHAEGASTVASGRWSHSEGAYTTSSNDASHAEGYRTAATYEYQHVQGKYNLQGDYAHIVGNGESESTRSNAHTLDWDGNAWFQGDVYVGGTGQDDPAAKKLMVEPTEDDALVLLAEVGMIDPIVDTNGAVYIENDNVLYTL